MLRKVLALLTRLTFAQRFMLASLIILVVGAIALGAWVGGQIKTGVIHRTAATTALYVDSFIAPNLQELAQGDPITAEHRATLDGLLKETTLGQEIAAFRVWDANGRILYSTEPSGVGLVFPVDSKLAHAWTGEVAAGISDLDEEENRSVRALGNSMMEVYIPVRLRGSSQIIAVAEFYQTVEELGSDIAAAQRRSWLMVGAGTLVTYLLLAGFVQRASNTIVRQQAELRNQVVRLKDILGQNEELHERVRRAASRNAALNESFLRRISAELHDGPVQYLGLALLRLDNVTANAEVCLGRNCGVRKDAEDLNVVKSSLSHALQEVRAISSGMALPELKDIGLGEMVARVVRIHERRTTTKVTVQLNKLPEQASLPVKITVYRLIQEALSNAFRHAGGVGQAVRVSCVGNELSVMVSDQGPGLDHAWENGWGEHLGMLGMRERVESLGGTFRIDSQLGRGTTVTARLPLEVEDVVTMS